MATTPLSPDPADGPLPARSRMGGDAAALVVAVAIHAALFAALTWHSDKAPPPIPPRIEVTISDLVGPSDTAPQPASNAAPDTAPTLGDAAPEPAASPKPVITPAPPPPPAPRVHERPAPIPAPLPRPEPRPVAKPEPKPVARPAPTPPRPEPRPVAKPVVKAPPVAKPTHPAPDPISKIVAHESPAKAGAKASARNSEKAGTSPKVSAKTADNDAGAQSDKAAANAAEKAKKTAGASKVGADFLKGVPGAKATTEAKSVAAQNVGPEVKAGLISAISRQIKPHWVSPQGADAEQLVTVVAWDLNEDGTLAGPPRVLRQEGITDSNRPQAQRHAEQAIRAVKLAAPFDLPAEYYSVWRRPVFRFDRKLSQ